MAEHRTVKEVLAKILLDFHQISLKEVDNMPFPAHVKESLRIEEQRRVDELKSNQYRITDNDNCGELIYEAHQFATFKGQLNIKTTTGEVRFNMITQVLSASYKDNPEKPSNTVQEFLPRYLGKFHLSALVGLEDAPLSKERKAVIALEEKKRLTQLAKGEFAIYDPDQSMGLIYVSHQLDPKNAMVFIRTTTVPLQYDIVNKILRKNHTVN